MTAGLPVELTAADDSPSTHGEDRHRELLPFLMITEQSASLYPPGPFSAAPRCPAPSQSNRDTERRFVVKILGRFIHTAFELAEDRFGLSRKQQPHIFHGTGIVLTRAQSGDAGAPAALHLIIEQGRGRLPSISSCRYGV